MNRSHQVEAEKVALLEKRKLQHQQLAEFHENQLDNDPIARKMHGQLALEHREEEVEAEEELRKERLRKAKPTQ
jgi:hypothetical protein